jgi:cytochrome c553/erythromycin esterase-like protein
MKLLAYVFVFVFLTHQSSAQTNDSSVVYLSSSKKTIKDGAKVFKQNCIACHGKNGEGNVIGPNLTDNYWLNGGTDQDILNSVKNGHEDKGMVSFEDALSEEEISSVSSYVVSLIGTYPKNAKAPQGSYYTREDEGEFDFVLEEDLFNSRYSDTSALKEMNYKILNLENDDDYSSFNMLDSIVGDYRVFFTGENHMFRSSNRKLQLKMFKYLYDKAGVRTLFIELGYARGYLMNEYIQTGDSTIYNILKTYSFDIYSEFYKDLQEFNETLDSNQKIKVIGIDVERFHGLSVKLLSMLFPEDKAVPDSISLHVESILGLASYQDDSYSSSDFEDRYWRSGYSARNTLDALFENFDSHREIYKEYVGEENYPILEKVMQSLVDKRTYDEYDEKNMPQGYVYREQYMYKNFINYIKEHPDEKFFGQFGRCHVSTTRQDEACSWHMFNSIATRLQNSNEPALKGKVLTIGNFYTQSSIYDDDLDEYPTLEYIVDNIDDNDYTLVEVTKDSLFEKLNEKYDFIIINNVAFDEEEEAADEVAEYEFDDFGFDMRFGAYGGYENLFADFDNLNNFFTGLGLDEISSPITIINYGMDIYNKGGVYWAMEGGQWLGHSTSISDSINIEVSGLRFMMYSGTDLFEKQWISLIPRLGLGYSNLKMTITQDNLKENIFGETSTRVYQNPAFLMDFGTELRFSYKLLSIGFKGGYLWDVSKKRWISNEIMIENSPEQSLSGLYLGATLSVFYTD